MSLDRSLRNQLENCVRRARDIAERGARSAIEQIGVGDVNPSDHLSAQERETRRRLRAHGRQLGDEPGHKKGTQTIERLVEEVAYEHWHRLLFASFLAENRLLMYPDPDGSVAVTIAECDDMAADEGARNGWELAARYAAIMLPEIFRLDSPIFSLDLPPESQQELQQLVSNLQPEVFMASDSLGWVYQFWQARRKEVVNSSGVKIGDRELPAVTQLFTEDYMVDFLLDNTLGAWLWLRVAERKPSLIEMEDEAELREAISLPGCPWTHLRFVKQENGNWEPAAGAFAGWPSQVKDLRCLDPCMGSGHFIVAMFERLTSLRVSEESVDERTAVFSVLQENLFGLEIDGRCTQIAAFNLALAAWRRIGFCTLPVLNLACCGLAPNVDKQAWVRMAQGDEKLESSMEQLYEHFEQAPVLGSLINPVKDNRSLLEAAFDEVKPLLDKALESESEDIGTIEMAVTASGLTKAAQMLASNFTLIATNVPFLGREKQCETLEQHIEEHYLAGKADLACAMLLRCLELCSPEGHIATVSPQYWLFLGRYEAFRRCMLRNASFRAVVKLGTGAFETITGEVVNTCLTVVQRSCPTDENFVSIDVGAKKGAQEKNFALVSCGFEVLNQKDQEANPDLVIGYKADPNKKLLAEYCYCYQGLATSDNAQFIFQFWEVPSLANGWEPFQMAPSNDGAAVGGLSWAILWEDGRGKYSKHAAALKAEGRLGGWKSGHEAWGKQGVAINRMSDLPVAIYCGAMFDCNVAVLVPHDEADLSWIWSYLRSDEYRREVRRLTQKTSVTNLTLIKIPVDKDEQIELEKQNKVKAVPRTDDPTQWLFHGSPRDASDALQVAVARLLGYRWPRQTGTAVRGCPALDSDSLDELADKDGIVCVPPVRGEAGAGDRLLDLLARSYGSEWSSDVLARQLKAVGFAGKSLDTWLRDGFFEQHCELFHQRPFIWQIWDGLRDGFSALVNYHKLDRRNLETLIYTYLGDWISRQTQSVSQSVDGAAERLAAAEQLKRRLELILEGDSPYDVFVRWKPLHAQALGWEPDLFDGVRSNIRPFLSVSDVKGKGAGILRSKPRIKWNKDKGKEPHRPINEFPWFWDWDEKSIDFPGIGTEPTGERHNDCHYSIKSKIAARGDRT